MRTATFQSLVFGIAGLLGIDTATDLLNDHVRAWAEFANTRAKEGWQFWNWPELEIVEQRSYRTQWTSALQFLRSNAQGQPDELYYQPNDTYYQVKASAGSDPTPGTLPTNTTFFQVLTPVNRYIALDQVGKQAIGDVVAVYPSDPGLSDTPVFALPHSLSQRGLEILGGNPGTTVWVLYKLPPSEFTADAYDNAATYAAGTLRYNLTDGNVYKALQSTTGHAPPNATYWSLVPVPAFLKEWLKLSVASDASDDLQTSGKLLNQANSAIEREVNKLYEQGEATPMRWGSRCNRLRVPLGVGNFWWSVFNPLGN